MEQLGFLISDCARRMRKAFDIHIRDFGVTGPQARLLGIISRKGGRPQAYYAGQLDVEAITLCRMIDRMELAGLVERRADPDDRRARLVSCTPRGLQRINELKSHMDGMIDKLTEGMEPERLQTLHEGLMQIYSRLAEFEGGDDLLQDEELANG